MAVLKAFALLAATARAQLVVPPVEGIVAELKPEYATGGSKESGATYAWVASPFGDCFSECGSNKFRTVECLSSDGLPPPDDDDSDCTGPKPPASKPCVCGGTEACGTVPADGCPAPGDGAGRPAYGFTRLGCFDFANPTLDHGTTTLHDKTCFGWKKSESCMDGLPFYALADKNMNADKCCKFCVSKSMDAFGLEGGVCRCGATVLNKEVWHEEAPNPALLFKPSALKPATTGCPLQVFLYTGHYEDDGVPSDLWDIKEDDLEYVDSIVKGKEVGELVEEDGTPDPSLEQAVAWVVGVTVFGALLALCWRCTSTSTPYGTTVLALSSRYVEGVDIPVPLDVLERVDVLVADAESYQQKDVEDQSSEADGSSRSPGTRNASKDKLKIGRRARTFI